MGQLHYKLELLTKSEGGIFMRKVGIVTDSTRFAEGIYRKIQYTSCAFKSSIWG